MDTHPLLIDEPPLLLRPTLACVFVHAGLTPGDRQALWTQQLHYWVQFHRQAGHRDTHHHEGRWWTWNSIASWHAQFPFWSQRTMERVIARSVQAGVTLSANYNRAGYDRTLWYTIDYACLDEMVHAWEQAHPDRQIDEMHFPTVAECISPECRNRDRQNGEMDRSSLTEPIPETSKDLPESERQRAWSTACRELRTLMTGATFSTWVRPLCLERVEREGGACRAVLRCPSTYVRDWCRHRLDRLLRDALAGALGVRAGALDLEYVLEASDEAT